MAEVHEISRGIYRISTWVEPAGITFNQFLVVDARSALIETGHRRLFPAVRDAVATVLDPGRLAYVVVPHFEGDECGALNEFLTVAPEAVPLASAWCVRTSLSDFSRRPPRIVADGEVVALGAKRLRFLYIPYAHAWEALVVFEETERVLFSSDLFMQGGRPTAPMTDADLSAQMVEIYRQSNGMPAIPAVAAAADKVSQLDLRLIAPMHGAALTAHFDRYIAALRAYGMGG